MAPPRKSLHRLGTELDLGPPSAYGWLAANAPRFGFIKRYSWEPWHYEAWPVAGVRARPMKSRSSPSALWASPVSIARRESRYRREALGLAKVGSRKLASTTGVTRAAGSKA